MTTAIMVSMYHVCGYHADCPKTSETWCLHQKDKINGTEYYKSKGALPLEVRNAILPVYRDLTKPEMLKKCLHGKTQNANESFNVMIWDRIPKIHYIGLAKLELGVYDAIANFNDGSKATLDIFKQVNVEPGFYTTKMCIDSNRKRKSLSIFKVSDDAKKRRKIKRAQKNQKHDKHIEKEGASYEAGGF